MTRGIAFDPESHSFAIDGVADAVQISRDDAIVLSSTTARSLPLAGFERALRDYEEADAATVSAVFVCDVPEEEFDPDTSVRAVSLVLLGRLQAEVAFAADPPADTLDVATLLSPLLEEVAGEYLGDYSDDQAGPVKVSLLGLAGEDRTLGQLVDLAEAAQTLVSAATGAGHLTAATVRDIVRSGAMNTLVGQPETTWIDAKGVPHSIATEAGKWELAKDVAAFANTGEAAIIVYGVKTAKATNGDVLDTAYPFEIARTDVEAMRAVLRGRITPQIQDLELELVEARGGYGYGLLYIPAQPIELQPFLVTGVVTDGLYMGTHVSYPVRVGEDTVYNSAAALHSFIAAGRVALSQPPASTDARPPA